MVGGMQAFIVFPCSRLFMLGAVTVWCAMPAWVIDQSGREQRVFKSEIDRSSMYNRLPRIFGKATEVLNRQ